VAASAAGALVVGLLLGVPDDFAQQLSIRRYDVGDGLAHSRVTSIYQDAKGYLWFGTWEGLSRFDGYRFVNYGTRDGLGNSVINTMVEDRQGHLWVGTNGSGVARFLDDPQESVVSGQGQKPTGNGQRTTVKTPATNDQRPATRPKFVSFPVSDWSPANRVNAMLFDSTGVLWCATDAGLYRAAAGQPGDLKFEAVVPHRTVALPMAALADSHGRLWFGVENDLIEIVPGHSIIYGRADEVGQQLITSIVQDRQGRVLVANFSAVFEFVASTTAASRGRWQRLPVTLQSGQAVTSMAADATGALWIGTFKGLIRYQEHRQTIYTSDQGLSDNAIRVLREDREGNLWIGTENGGMCKLSSEMIFSFTRVEGLPNQFIYKVIVDRQGRVYASTGEGVVQIVGDKAIPIPRSQFPPFNLIGSRLIQDRRGDWWVGTDQGLFRFQESELQLRHGQKVTSVDGISEMAIVSIHEDAGGRVWISLMDGSLYWVDPAHPTPLPSPGGGRNQGRGALWFQRIPPEAIAPLAGSPWMMGDRAGALWIGSHSLLGRLMNGSVVRFRPTAGLPDDNPRAFFQDSRGWLWIGLRYGGVSMTKDPTAEPPTFVNYSTENGLVSDQVLAIAEDDSGRMYFGTGRGLDRLDLRSGRLRHFSTADGLAGNQISHLEKDHDGTIWIATAKGLSRFNPRAELMVNRPPPVYLSRAQVAGEDLPLAETGATRLPELQLPAARNNLLVEYVGLEFQGEHGLRYQCKLEGVDADWGPPTERRSVNYAHLAPGSYRFLARAIDQQGLASAEPAVLAFRILPPMWQQWWFRLLAALVVMAAAYASYRYRVARLLELERVRTRIASDLHDDIGAGLSQMALLSEMAKYYIHLDPPRSMQIMTDVAGRCRELVDTMSDIVWSIDPRQDDLKKLMARVRQFASDVLEAKGIGWAFETPPQPERITLSPEQRRHLFLIFKEAVNNASRHARCTSVSMSLRVIGHQLSAEIRDNGCGFVADRGSQIAPACPAGKDRGSNDPARRPPPASPMPPPRQGHGLQNMRARAQELGGQLQVESAPGQGTRLILSVPLK
jgi:ligand-binding sensor domain-containing protein/signal transduction histidine kinase